MEDLPEQPVLNPADTGDQVGTVREAGLRDVHTALAAAGNANWSQVAPEERARLLDNFADLMEAHQDELMMLAVREAGKTFANALAEVREAVDFCRYYAAQLRTEFAPRHPPAPGTGGLHQPLEFSAGHFRGAVRCRTGSRQSGTGQTGRADAACRGAGRTPDARSRHPA